MLYKKRCMPLGRPLRFARAFSSLHGNTINNLVVKPAVKRVFSFWFEMQCGLPYCCDQ